MSVTPLEDIEIEGWPLMPPGQYLATYQRYELALIFNTAKCFVHLRIEGGAYCGTWLYRPYRVKKIVRKTKRGGRFTVGTSHELFRQFARLTDAQVRPDRISLHQLRGCLIRISVVTVTHDAKRRALPKAAQYSRVDELLAIEAGSIS